MCVFPATPCVTLEEKAELASTPAVVVGALPQRQSFSIFKAGNTDSGWHVSLAFLPLLYLINRSNLIPRVELNFNDVQLDFQLVSSPEDMTGGRGTVAGVTM